jgi:hypothetical protein
MLPDMPWRLCPRWLGPTYKLALLLFPAVIINLSQLEPFLSHPADPKHGLVIFAALSLRKHVQRERERELQQHRFIV